mmetsp:Transcript_22205/g.56015  ORF Transcript_22205/g.56015 Transcript_22205/m.56015 type:complete len:400 (-) Transcript_22205:89-1288(-)|eukprot:CAMPEP_0174922832 /NCGR_PEP_ID=MMETSP1355-20121228/6167_1 /TAXON_ID=464990 /ORGANISM="Hemiselmis tepida, Strain CCMP443" /LENGTH=399 /DNA_ID=CAMNT_0016168471 /DNA_START=51 /DNA_END=1250 /DNA_ORIENTATION=-
MCNKRETAGRHAFGACGGDPAEEREGGAEHPLGAAPGGWRIGRSCGRPRRRGALLAWAAMLTCLSYVAPEVECTTGGKLERQELRLTSKKAILGDWARDPALIEELSSSFQAGEPFPHVVIPNFFSEEVATRIEAAFPNPEGEGSRAWKAQGWHVYDNPIEGKLALDDVESMEKHDDIFRDMWGELQSTGLVSLLSNVTKIEGLENDPHLHGAGLHYHPPGSRLEMHLDYSIHPITGKERRVNLIIYMNRDWDDEWGGELALWEGTPNGMTRGPVQKIKPRFNQAALFRTSDISWHGMPDPVRCPPGRARKSVAIYYVSDARAEATPRYKASYKARPDDAIRGTAAFEGYSRLCETRIQRRLEYGDVVEALPGWLPRWPADGAAGAGAAGAVGGGKADL